MRLFALTIALLVVVQTPAATGTIDIVVTDANGAPLAGLQAQDLMLRIDGRVHQILDLRLVNQNTEASVLPPPYASNQTPAARTVAVVADVTRLQSTDIPQVKSSVDAVAQALAPRDRVSVIALATDGMAADYTTRREIVRAAADRLSGAAPPLQDTKTLETAAVTSLSMLEQFSGRLALDPGHKTLVFIAPPFPATSTTRRAIQSLAAVTAAQRIQLVIIDPRPGEPTPGGLAALAAATGATLMPSSNELSVRFGQVAGRGATRYELRFAPAEELRDDKLHRVQVATLRKDAQITAPAQLHIPKSGSAVNALAALADMLRQPRQWSDLPLRVAVFPVLDVERDRLRLLVLGETEEPTTALAWAEFAVIAPSGAVVATWKAEAADLATRPIMTAALVAPGAYRLRMVASELTGRRGSVDYEFDARLAPAGPLALGPMMFGGIANEAFLPFLHFPADIKAVMAYAEIYGVPAAGDTITAAFEVAATADGPAIANAAGSVRTTPNNDRRAALGVIDLATLAPGDYVVRAVVSLNGKEIGRVSRTLRKAAR